MARNYDAQTEIDAQLRREYARRRQPQTTPIAWLVTLAALAIVAVCAVALWKLGVIGAALGAAPTPIIQTQPTAALPTSAPFPTTNADQREIIGQQAPHDVRGALSTPAPAPAVDVAPEYVAPVELPPAAPVPTIQPAQAEIIGARQSNGCAAGQVFMPRTGCYTPNSAGPMPGPVGAP